MSSRSSRPGRNPAAVSLCLMLACVAVGVLCTATAHASYYKMLLCAGNNGSNGYSTQTNTTSPQNPGGIFSFENYCGPAPDPAGSNAFLRIDETQPSGNAGNGAYGSISWTAPAWVSIAQAGGYTREPNAFNEGWRGRFWAEGYDGSTNNILMQGYQVENGSLGGIGWGLTQTFAPHLWPWGGSYGSYRRFVFEMTCTRPAGCDRSNFNAVDANSMTLILNDTSPSQINLTDTESGLLSGQWVRGAQPVTWNVSDQGSGMRFERVRVDGNQVDAIDWRGSCNIDADATSGEFAREFVPCPTGGPWQRSWALDTSTLSDGAHTVQVCSQDYGQAVGLAGTGGESCDARTIHVDNTAPGAPSGLHIVSSNPNRYLSQLGATFSLPPNQGSPITRVHYVVAKVGGGAVMPEQVVSATNPTELPKVEAPTTPGNYELRVWLEDAVGFAGPYATVPIPRDTTPPAAPQDLSVTAPETPRSAQGFDVRWNNIVDGGSPISAVHYQVLNGAGDVVVPTKTVSGSSPEAIEDLETPRERGAYTLRVWLEDAEGNVGAAASAPLSYDCVRSDVGGGTGLTAGLGTDGASSILVNQGEGSTLSGKLQGSQVGGAALCVYSNVITDHEPQFLGLAIASADGSYQFAVGAGPSREVSVAYRPGQRELSASAVLRTRVHPTFELKRKVVHNQGFGVFTGSVPGPHNGNVVVTLQVRSGKAWRVFRSYHTREDGRYVMRYRFTHTDTPTIYVVRAQVRQQSGYAYEEGASRALPLRVKP